jgi:hypothetical protein
LRIRRPPQYRTSLPKCLSLTGGNKVDTLESVASCADSSSELRPPSSLQLPAGCFPKVTNNDRARFQIGRIVVPERTPFALAASKGVGPMDPFAPAAQESRRTSESPVHGVLEQQ